MPQISRDEYTAEDQARYDAAYYQLRRIVRSGAPDAAVLFSRVLDEALEAGFPVDWQNKNGWTPLHWAVDYVPSVRAGLPQILIKAGTDVNIQNNDNRTPLSKACRNYVWKGTPGYLQTIDALLEAGARPELGEDWWTGRRWYWADQQERRGWLETYITSWAARRARDRAGDAAPGFDYAL